MDGHSPSPGGSTAPGEPVQPGADASVFHAVEALATELRGIFDDHLQLFALEGRRAGTSLVTILACGVAVGVLVVSTWLGLVGAAALLLVAFGLDASAAMLGVAAINLLAVFGLLHLIRQRGRDLGFPATSRAIRAITAPGPRA